MSKLSVHLNNTANIDTVQYNVHKGFPNFLNFLGTMSAALIMRVHFTIV